MHSSRNPLSSDRNNMAHPSIYASSVFNHSVTQSFSASAFIQQTNHPTIDLNIDMTISYIHPPSHLSVLSHIHLSIPSFIHLSIHPSMHGFMFSAIHPSIHPSIHPYESSLAYTRTHTSVRPSIRPHNTHNSYLHMQQKYCHESSEGTPRLCSK